MFTLLMDFVEFFEFPFTFPERLWKTIDIELKNCRVCSSSIRAKRRWWVTSNHSEQQKTLNRNIYWNYTNSRLFCNTEKIAKVILINLIQFHAFTRIAYLSFRKNLSNIENNENEMSTVKCSHIIRFKFPQVFDPIPTTITLYTEGESVDDDD